jgi:hypothetical protein
MLWAPVPLYRITGSLYFIHCVLKLSVASMRHVNSINIRKKLRVLVNTLNCQWWLVTL